MLVGETRKRKGEMCIYMHTYVYIHAQKEREGERRILRGVDKM